MFILKKILTPFILPPGIFIILLMVYGTWLLFRRNWKAGVVNITIACSMWLLSIPPVSDAMHRGLESHFSLPKNLQADVIIVLDGGGNSKAPDLSGFGAPSEKKLGRIVTAVRLYKRLNVPIILSGGSVFVNQKSAEPPIFKRFLVDLGVPANEIIVERKSRDTFENAKFAREICIRSGYENPILITSASHMRRSLMSFEKAGLEVIPFPAGFKWWRDKRYGWTDFLPHDFRDASTAIREYLGLAFYKFAY